MEAGVPRPSPGGERETARLEAFSDGVYAFAITLLALELHVPHVPGENAEASARWLCLALTAQWPSYLAFAASFITVLIMWTHHHSLFRLVQKNSPRLQFTNGLLLLLTTTVSFPTAVVAEYIDTPAAPVAAVLYVGQQVLLATVFVLLLGVVTGEGTLSPEVPAETVRSMKRSYRIGPPLYAVTLAIAFFSPKVAIAISVSLWVFWAFVPTMTSRQRHASSSQ
jgi:uncharacterized membrane protein